MKKCLEIKFSYNDLVDGELIKVDEYLSSIEIAEEEASILKGIDASLFTDLLLKKLMDASLDKTHVWNSQLESLLNKNSSISYNIVEKDINIKTPKIELKGNHFGSQANIREFKNDINNLPTNIVSNGTLAIKTVLDTVIKLDNKKNDKIGIFYISGFIDLDNYSINNDDGLNAWYDSEHNVMYVKSNDQSVNGVNDEVSFDFAKEMMKYVLSNIHNSSIPAELLKPFSRNAELKNKNAYEIFEFLENNNNYTKNTKNILNLFGHIFDVSEESLPNLARILVLGKANTSKITKTKTTNGDRNLKQEIEEQSKLKNKKPGRGKRSIDSIPSDSQPIKNKVSKSVNTMPFIKNMLSPDDHIKLHRVVDRLKSLYPDVEFIYANSNEIERNYAKGNFSPHEVRAFVSGKTIVINTDYVTLAEPIHELGHIILTGLKETNTDLYNAIISKMQTHPKFDKLKSYYQELNNEELAEETFVTMLGEHFVGMDETQDVSDWKENNAPFFKRLFYNIKKWFSELLGIDDKRFFRLEPEEIMTMSINDLLSKFNTYAMNGAFSNEVNVVSKTLDVIENDELGLNSIGNLSSTSLQLLENSDLDFNLITVNKLILKLHSEEFLKWGGDEIITNSDGEPRIFFRTNTDGIVSDNDLDGSGDIVFVKGGITQEGENYRVAPANIKSAFTVDMITKPIEKNKNLDDLIHSQGYKLIGSNAEINYMISKVKLMFPDMQFDKVKLGSLYTVNWYPEPKKKVLDLKKELMSKNIIREVC